MPRREREHRSIASGREFRARSVWPSSVRRLFQPDGGPDRRLGPRGGITTRQIVTRHRVAAQAGWATHHGQHSVENEQVGPLEFEAWPSVGGHRQAAHRHSAWSVCRWVDSNTRLSSSQFRDTPSSPARFVWTSRTQGFCGLVLLFGHIDLRH